jgi:predicted metal-binding membrane protein
MSESKLLIAAGATVLWAIFGVLLFELTSLVSAFELAVSGPIFDLTRVTRRKPTASAVGGIRQYS